MPQKKRTKTNSLPSERQILPRSFRITKRSDFAALQKKGRRIKANDLHFILCKNQIGITRLGLVVSKKVDKRASVRNLLKRRLREIFRRNRTIFPVSFDILIIARQNSTNLSFTELKEQFLKAFSGRHIKKE